MTMPVIRIAQQFGPDIGERLRARLPQCEIVDTPMGPGGWHPSFDVLLSGPTKSWKGQPRPSGWPGRLRWMQLPSTGVDAYPDWVFDVPAVSTAPGLNAPAIAEFVLASMLAREKRFPAAWVQSRDGWSAPPMGTLRGKTLALAGIGAIGTAVARHALALGMQVVALRRSTSRPMEGVSVVHDIMSLAPLADHLVLCLPSTPETQHIVDARFLAACRPGVHIVNVARGTLIDQKALLAALDKDPTATASLDVTDPEPLPAGHALYQHPRVWLSPHVAWNSPDTLPRLLDLFAEQFARFSSGQPPLFCVEPPPSTLRVP